MKLCNHCSEVKYNKDFHKNKWSSDGLQNWCKECQTHTKETPIIVRVHEYYISDDIIENKEENKSIFSWLKNLFRRNK